MGQLLFVTALHIYCVQHVLACSLPFAWSTTQFQFWCFLQLQSNSYITTALVFVVNRLARAHKYAQPLLDR